MTVAHAIEAPSDGYAGVVARGAGSAGEASIKRSWTFVLRSRGDCPIKAMAAIASTMVALVSEPAHCTPTASAIDRYVMPYVQTNNFSGVLLVSRDGKQIVSRAYGIADRKRGLKNKLETQFHIASISMQFTAAATLRLIMRHKLTLDTPVSKYVPELPNAAEITVRHLLTQTSGIRDINGLDDYDSLLEHHQTPEDLVEHIVRLPPDRRPGSFEREEHSAYNLLALIIEKETKVPFAAAVRDLVFRPLGMSRTGIDDDRVSKPAGMAKGYVPIGVSALEPAPTIHWSAKAGNASAYTSAADHLRFLQGLLDPRFLSPSLRAVIFDTGTLIGYGWFRNHNSARFAQPVYSMNGRAPGFASAVIYVPHAKLYVAAFGNIYASFPSGISADVAALVLKLPYQAANLTTSADPASLEGLPARFQFGSDFYQANAVVIVSTKNGEVSLDWPSGDRSPLIPAGRDQYVDRAYGVPVRLIRNTAGRPLELRYDRFEGRVIATGEIGGTLPDVRSEAGATVETISAR